MMLAVDVGATRLRVAVGTPDGRILRKIVVNTPRSGGKLAVAERIVEIASKLLGERKPEAVGVASIGPLDLGRGWVVNTPNNPIRSFSLSEPLAEALASRVILANDCMAAVWGEHVYGLGGGLGDLAYITISTGIGGGFMVDGHLLVGWRGNAHEIGHLVIDYKSNTRCGCGGRGHWEGLASGSGLPRLASLMAQQYRYESTAWSKAVEGRLSSREIYLYARRGDSFALRVIDEANRIHAAGLAGVIASYDPRLIVLGGAVAVRNHDLLIPGIRRYLEEYSLHKPPRIEVSAFGEDSVLMGALAIASHTPPELERFSFNPRK